MCYRIAAVLIGIGLTLSLAPVTAIGESDTRVADSTEADTSALIELAVPDSHRATDPAGQPASYDRFVDENKNGVDDKYETEEKSKVKINVIHAPSKPNRDKEPEEKKQPDKP